MPKVRRSERIAAITNMLVSNPGKLFQLKVFASRFATAKSTISEDIGIIKRTFRRMDMGMVCTVTGAAGGVKYLPHRSPVYIKETAEELCAKLSDPERILPGGFLYMSDLITSPRFMARTGQVFASCFSRENADCVMTMETKGIPVAMMTARAMNLPLVVIRRQSRVTEGSVVSITYVSGSSEKIQTMSLPRRALSLGARVLFIDDFMRAGGTARGVESLVREFEGEVLGVGVLVETEEPKNKLIADYLSLAVLKGVEPSRGKVFIEPASWVVSGE